MEQEAFLTWNPWHGCRKYSEGCAHCYMYYLDAQRDRDGSEIYRTKTNFNLPVKKTRQGAYKIPSGTMLHVCALVGAAELLAPYITKLFVGYDAKLHAMTQTGFRICCLVYLINGFNIFGSSFFTALNNGPLSALISFLRTLIFQIAAVLLLPLLFGIMGIWWSINAAELLTLCVTLMLLFTMRGRYHYA